MLGLGENMRATIYTDPLYRIADIDNRIYSSFIEHLGRAVYDGIYNPDHESADMLGFREDVKNVIKELHIPMIRYPGGNFVSGFRWEDSVGPRNMRPRRLDYAWRSLETNQVGLAEFYQWCKDIDSEIMLAVNLGTRGIEAACDLLEYCNHPQGTRLSDLRISHGSKKPYDIKVWCLGNEMDGEWQIGHKNAEEYGRLACETARAMRKIDPEIQLVVAGSSNPDMKTFPEWERQVLEHTYEDVDYLSLHQYLGDNTNDIDDYLAMALSTEDFIHTVECTCDYVKAKKRSKKKMFLSFDEWNIWYHTYCADQEAMESSPWKTNPQLLEDIYTITDAVVFGSMLITILKHADRVKIACLAQLVNVIAPIHTEVNGGGIWKQTIYWPFAQMCKYGKGCVLNNVVSSPKYDSKSFCDVPYLESICIYNELQSELVIFAVNRSRKEALELEVDLRAFGDCEIIEHSSLFHKNCKMINGYGAEVVFPKRIDRSQIAESRLQASLPPVSWNMLRVSQGQRNDFCD